MNVTDRLPRMFDLAKRCIDAGANAMMVNYLAVGPEAMRALADDPAINVPILAHMDLAGAFYMSPYQGISSPIIFGKFSRLCGADAIVLPFSMGGKAVYMHDRFMTTTRCLTYPMGNLKPTMPMPSGGITPANVAGHRLRRGQGHHDRLGRRHPRPSQGTQGRRPRLAPGHRRRHAEHSGRRVRQASTRNWASPSASGARRPISRSSAT